MAAVINNQINNNTDEISLKELIQKMGEWWNYLLTQWWKIATVGFIGGCIGFVYASKQPLTYTAKLTFVVEDGKSSGGMGGLASLAGQFGVDMGGGSGSGILSGDNILFYFKSTSLSREVLLSKFDSTSNKSIADVYSEVYKLKDEWNKNEKIGNVNFPISNTTKYYSRLQDSLLQQIIISINKAQFIIAKTDKKASFIDVSTTMINEKLAKIYCERIVERAVDRYITIKTQQQKATVDKLQVRVDSIANLLKQKTISGASLQTSSSTIDINPLYKTETEVAIETTVRDKTMLATIFASVTQNLEMAKFTLSQQTPVIQIIDYPQYPLKKQKLSSSQTAIIYSFLGAFIFLFVLIFRRGIFEIMKKDSSIQKV